MEQKYVQLKELDINTLIENYDVGNYIVSARYLKEASDLLMHNEQEISNVLLQLAKAILDIAEIANTRQTTNNILSSNGK